MRAARVFIGVGRRHPLVSLQMLEAYEIGSKMRWVKDLQQSLEKLGWRGLNVVALDGLKIKEVHETAVEGYSIEGDGE